MPIVKQQIDEYCKRTPNIVKFASAYENGRSHKEINRGNIYQEQADELGHMLKITLKCSAMI